MSIIKCISFLNDIPHLSGKYLIRIRNFWKKTKTVNDIFDITRCQACIFFDLIPRFLMIHKFNLQHFFSWLSSLIPTKEKSCGLCNISDRTESNWSDNKGVSKVFLFYRPVLQSLFHVCIYKQSMTSLYYLYINMLVCNWISNICVCNPFSYKYICNVGCFCETKCFKSTERERERETERQRDRQTEMF